MKKYLYFAKKNIWGLKSATHGLTDFTWEPREYLLDSAAEEGISVV